MSSYDLTIRNGTIATASDTFDGDIAVKDGVIVHIGKGLEAAARDIDASGRLVLPGGIDSHCHVEQVSGGGIMCADDFYSATVSAAFGGNTTIVPFAAQHRGKPLRGSVEDYWKLAEAKSILDFAFHPIIADPTEEALSRDLPYLMEQGITSYKVFLTYDAMKLTDHQMLQVLSATKREGAIVMVHAENHDLIQFLAKGFLESGCVHPRFHAKSHTAIAEREAVNRAISLAEATGASLLIVHVSDPVSTDMVRQAQGRGLPIFGETCPQYLFLTEDMMDTPGVEGLKLCFSPPARDKASHEAVWNGLADGTFQVFSSDHAPFRFDKSGKLPRGDKTTFKESANGIPGLEVRMPLLFSEGVKKGRIGLNKFVALTATNHAKVYGLHPRKGTIAVGADADVALWDPERRLTITADMIHDNVDYTPFEGMEVTGWPTTVVSRGDIIINEGRLDAARGRGQFLRCAKPAASPREV